MQVNSFNSEVRLLDIVNKGKANSAKSSAAEKGDLKKSFSEVLGQAKGLNFSKHASQRLYSRGIEMSNERLTKLTEAVDKAADKGAKESLILDDSAAYVVSVPNRTVITAFDRNNLQDGVFTSIDSAIIL
jgi:flagellar operon protein